MAFNGGNKIAKRKDEAEVSLCHIWGQKGVKKPAAVRPERGSRGIRYSASDRGNMTSAQAGPITFLGDQQKERKGPLKSAAIARVNGIE